ncbi:hypothetical protein [Methylobacterium sp. Leaf85]|uniref:hypothetical protein n=1 Tax=Methylobacterium sp. Leaf85 TaxID=1736241 RepID=UPI0006FED606|nr:hypothetical protein [Methylobacterium sp. Leaf85]KQO49748.1 hypothetical protein ASF08_22910 [Methylobacterium sp. Leaf85]
MPTATAYATEARYPEHAALCRSLAGLLVTTKRATRTRGDEIISRYDAAAGARAAASMEDRLLALVAGQVEKPGARERVCKRLPSAYPAALGQGVRSPKVRSEIRAEAFEGWGLARLLAALDACGYEATLTVKPKSP